MGQGTRVLLAQDVRALLAATMMPLAASSLKTAQPSSAQTAWGMPLEKSLGPGRWIGGTLSFSFVPAEPVTEENIELPSYIGLETTVHFQPEGKQAKAYGEWVLTQAEAQKVIGSLMENHIDITGIHSTLIPQTPAMVSAYRFLGGRGCPEAGQVFQRSAEADQANRLDARRSERNKTTLNLKVK